MASSTTIEALLDELRFGKLEKKVKSHLLNVYTAMGVALLTCACGAYLPMFTGVLTTKLFVATFVAQLVILLFLVFTPPTKENMSNRMGMLLIFSFLAGINLCPILERAMIIDPSIIVTAFFATSLIFISFSLSALLSNDRKWLAMGGTLLSILWWLVLFAILNLYFGSELLFKVQLYISLITICACVLYDTQLIVERCRNGDDDYVMHCLLLFQDFIGIFRDLVMILSSKGDVKVKQRND